MDIKFIIKKPVVTEKSLLLAAKGVYCLYVDPVAKKTEIVSAVESIWNVSVKDIKTIKIPGKRKRAGGRRKMYTTPVRKKALIRLKDGQSIPQFEQWYSLSTEEVTEDVDKKQKTKEKKTTKK